MEKEKGGGEGLAAKNTATKKSKSVDGVSVGISKLSIGGSKKTKKTANFTMYSQKGSVKSNKTSKTTANFSFAGKSCANDGTVKGSAKASQLTPVISTTLEKAIAAGVLSLGQVDHYNDEKLNQRAGVHLVLANGNCLDISCRKSETNPKQLVLLLGIPDNFTELGKKFGHLIPRIMEQHNCDETVARQILKTHPRTLEAQKNLKKLAGHRNEEAFENGETLYAELRLTLEFEVAAELVTAEEDPVHYGWTLKGPGLEQESEDNGYHFYFELKEKDKPFKPVTSSVDSSNKKSTPQRSNKKSMFGGYTGMPSVPESDSVPGEVSFQSPFKPPGAEKDDDSTICTEEQDQRFAKQGSKPGEQMEVDSDDDDSSFDSDLVADDDDSENERLAAKVKEQEEQMKEQEEKMKEQQEQITKLLETQTQFMEFMNGQAGLKKSKSQESEESGNSSPKKKKGNEGKAEASTEQSTCSRKTRGSAAREEKRKTAEKKKQS